MRIVAYEGGRHGDDASAAPAARGGRDQVREGDLEGVEGADGVDVDDGLEGIGAEARDGRDKVACCASAVVIKVLAGAIWAGREEDLGRDERARWAVLHDIVDGAELPDAAVCCCLERLELLLSSVSKSGSRSMGGYYLRCH